MSSSPLYGVLPLLGNRSRISAALAALCSRKNCVLCKNAKDIISSLNSNALRASSAYGGVSDWIIREACKHAARWQCRDQRRFRVAVSRLANTVQGDELVSPTTEATQAADVSAHVLYREVRETAVMSDVEAASRIDPVARQIAQPYRVMTSAPVIRASLIVRACRWTT